MQTFQISAADGWGFSAEKTFTCGQCFRFRPSGDGYEGVARGRRAVVRDGSIDCEPDDLAFWREYLALGDELGRLNRFVELGEYAAESTERGRGIRLLRQEPWEALCSFIVSQCNNIPRIMGIIDRLCASLGENGAFPTAERIAALPDDGLDFLRSGYRAPYILSAARAVASGSLDLDALIDASYDTARKTLLSLPGVGPKVANCVLLFGLYHGEAFPVDVWMKRALKRLPPDFDPASLGRDAGYFQQCLFFNAREGD